MPTATECICCNALSEVNTNEEKNVDCTTTEYSGFHYNCLQMYVLKAEYHEYQDANEPPLEDELIHENMRFYLKKIDISNVL